MHFESRLVAPRLIETIRRERISVLAAVPRVIALLKTHMEIDASGAGDGRLALAEQKLGAAGAAAGLFRDVHRALGL